VSGEDLQWEEFVEKACFELDWKRVRVMDGESGDEVGFNFLSRL